MELAVGRKAEAELVGLVERLKGEKEGLERKATKEGQAARAGRKRLEERCQEELLAKEQEVVGLRERLVKLEDIE